MIKKQTISVLYFMENIVTKGENSCNGHFLVLAVFSKALSFSVVKSCYYLLTHSHTMTPFDAPGKQAF